MTFVRLRSDIDPGALAARLRDFVPAHYPDPDGPTPLFQSLFLHSMADVHLHPFNPDTSEPDDREQALYAIAATGFFILLLAGINFVNLVDRTGRLPRQRGGNPQGGRSVARSADRPVHGRVAWATHLSALCLAWHWRPSSCPA